MGLSEKQIERVKKHLNKNIGDSRCRMCGNDQRKVHPDLVCTVQAEIRNGEMSIFPHEATPLVQVVCPTCCHVEHFLADAILRD